MKKAKFEQIRQLQTNGINYDLDTEDIVEKLEQWDTLYGIELSNIEQDSVTVKFDSLPDDFGELAGEIYEFCPDVIDQHFGCMDEMVEMMGSEGLSPALAELVEGVNFGDENFGEILLQKSLQSTQTVVLWWD